MTVSCLRVAATSSPSLRGGYQNIHDNSDPHCQSCALYPAYSGSEMPGITCRRADALNSDAEDVDGVRGGGDGERMRDRAVPQCVCRATIWLVWWGAGS